MTDWTFIRDGDQPEEKRLICERCKSSAVFTLPISLSLLVDVTKAFEREHRRCKV